MPVASELLVKVGADTKEAESGLARVDKQVSGFAKSAGALGSVATAAFLGVGAAAVGLGVGFGKSIGLASDFQAVISEVGAVSNATAPELEQLSDLALQMGADTAFSASEAAQAMAELAKGGIEVADMAAVLPGTLDLAAAGGLGLAEAATIATDSMAIFGSQGVTMERVADAFAGAANISSISVQDMAESMKYVGPVAASMGMSIEDTAAAVALLGANGLKGSQAGTGLRTMLTRLASPSKEARTLMKDLGLEVFDSSGKMKDFAGISDELKGSLKGMTDQQRLATLETLFGTEGMGAAIAMMGDGENSVQSYTDKLKNAASANATGKKMLDNFSGSVEALKGSLESAAIRLGLAFLPALRGVVDGLTGAVNALTPFIESVGPKLASALTSVFGVLGQFGSYVGGVATALFDAFSKLQSGEITLSQFIGGVKSLITTVLGDIGTLLSNVAGFLAPFLAKIGAGITAALPIIGAELVKVGQAFGGWIIGTAIPFLQTNLPLWLTALSTWVTGTALPAILGFVGSIGAAFGGWITGTAIPYLTTNLPLWLAALQTWVTTTAVPAVTTALVAVGTAFGDWVATRAVPWVQENLPGYLAAIGTWVTATAVPAVTSFLVAVGTAFGDWVATTAVPYLQEKLPEWLAAITTWISGTAIPAIQTSADELSTALTAWINEKAIPKVEQDMPGWLAAITKQVDAANAAVDSGTTTLADTLGTWITKKAIPLLTADLGTFALVMVAWFPTVTILLASKATEWAKALTEWINNPAQAMLKANLADFLNSISTWILTSTFIVFILAWKLGEAIGKGMGEGVVEAWGAVRDWLSGLPERIKAAVGDLGNSLFVSGQQVMQGLINGILSKLPSLISVGGQIAGAVAGAVAGGLEQRSPSRVMMAIGRDTIEGLIIGMDEKEGEAAKKAADVASAIAKAVTDTLGAMKALANFDFAKDSPSGEALGWFRHLTESLIATMQEAASGFEDKALEHVGKFSDAVGKVGSSVKSAVDGLMALGKADWANSSPDGNAIGWFMHMVSSLVQSFVNAGKDFEEDGLAGATRFADAVSKVTGVISGAVTGLQSLAKFVAPAEEKVSLFMRSLADMMEKFGVWAGGFEADGLAQSSIFAEAVGKVVGILGNGVTGLMALAKFAAPAEENVTAFMTSLADLMEKFGTWAGNFEQDVLESTSRFAEAAGKVAGIIGPAVTGFKDLATLSAPSETAIDQLVAGIRYIVKRFGEMATMLDTEGAKHLADFSDAAGKALAAAKTGTDLFKAFDKLGIPSAKAIDELMEGIKYVVRRFGEMAREVSEEGLTQLQAFSTAAGQSLAAAKAGTDLFKSMEKLAVPSAAAIDFLLGTIGYIINRIREIANGIGTQGLQEAQNFAEGSFNVINTLASSLKLFEEISKFKDIPAKKLEELHTALQGALDWARNVTARTSAIKAEAAEAANNMKEAARMFAEAASLGNGIPTMPTGPTGGWGEYIPALASGGVVTKPTLALIGERGPEAVVPINQYRGGSGSGGGTVQIIFQGPVYGTADFDKRVQQAKVALTKQGRWN